MDLVSFSTIKKNIWNLCGHLCLSSLMLTRAQPGQQFVRLFLCSVCQVEKQLHRLWDVPP